MPSPQAEGPSIAGCMLLLIQYMSSSSPYLEATSPIHNLRRGHDVMKTDSVNVPKKKKKISPSEFCSVIFLIP
jgi:hypothetical protein